MNFPLMVNRKTRPLKYPTGTCRGQSTGPTWMDAGKLWNGSRDCSIMGKGEDDKNNLDQVLLFSQLVMKALLEYPEEVSV